MSAPDQAAPQTIAIVEDDAEIRDLVSGYLAREGFTVLTFADGAAFDRHLHGTDAPPDAVVLDLMMPGEDGLSICRRLAPRLPVLILSAKGEDLDRIIGLEVGADDYQPKPFNPRELVARLRAILRRGKTPEAGEAPSEPVERYAFEGWRFDAQSRALTAPDGAPVELSHGEFALLLEFVRRPQRVLSREQLLDWTRGRDAEPFDRAVDVQLSRLRKKLGDDARRAELIKTVRGGGYLFSAAVRKTR